MTYSAAGLGKLNDVMETERMPVERSEPGDRSTFIAMLDRWGVPFELLGNDIRIAADDAEEITSGYTGFYCDWSFSDDGLFIGLGIWE